MGQRLVWLARRLSNQSHEDQCSPKKGRTAEGLHFIFIFTPASTGCLASSQQGVLGTQRLGVTYDAQLISSILHAQNKLREFQLHSSHALPQCQLSAARGIWWFCSLHVNGYPHIGRCVWILVTSSEFCKLLSVWTNFIQTHEKNSLML